MYRKRSHIKHMKLYESFQLYAERRAYMILLWIYTYLTVCVAVLLLNPSTNRYYCLHRALRCIFLFVCILSFSDDSYNVSLFNTRSSQQQQYPPRASCFDELVIEIINDLRFSRAADDDPHICMHLLFSVCY